jgi:hypothetical protein
LRALEEIRGELTREAAARFYRELNAASLLLAQDQPPSSPGPGQEPTELQLPVLTTIGPDGKRWLVAFTDLEHLTARFPGAQGYVVLPARAVAQMVLQDPGTEGLVLNPGLGNDGAQPIERHGLEAVAQGKAPGSL